MTGTRTPLTSGERQHLLQAHRLDSGLFAGATATGDLEVDSARGIIEGYLKTWQRDAYNTKWLPGSFDRTIRERHTLMLAAGDRSDINYRLEHNREKACGYALELVPDSQGLRSVFQLVDFTTRGSAGYTALVLAKERVSKGQSIGFDYVWDQVDFLSDKEMRDEGLDPTDPIYWWMPALDLRDCDLREGSLTCDPADRPARVDVVRSIGRVLVPGWRAPDAPARAQEAPEGSPASLILHLNLPPGSDVTQAGERIKRAMGPGEAPEPTTPTPPEPPTQERSFADLCAAVAARL